MPMISLKRWMKRYGLTNLEIPANAKDPSSSPKSESLMLHNHKVMLDMIWLDFGAGSQLDEFFEKWWPRLNSKGGLIMVHSSLTNVKTRRWLVNYQADDSDKRKGLGGFDLWGLLEPHKRYQNSFSVFQKRSNVYMEPIYSFGP